MDGDRPTLRTRPRLPVYDMGARLMEATERMKRFVVVPSTVETRGVARIMHYHGIIAGMRDFNNRRAFAVELKYYQGAGVLQFFTAVRCNEETNETEWSPMMVRRLASSTAAGAIRIVCVRAWDGRILDQFQAMKEGIGGTGLCMIH